MTPTCLTRKELRPDLGARSRVRNHSSTTPQNIFAIKKSTKSIDTSAVRYSRSIGPIDVTKTRSMSRPLSSMTNGKLAMPKAEQASGHHQNRACSLTSDFPGVGPPAARSSGCERRNHPYLTVPTLGNRIQSIIIARHSCRGQLIGELFRDKAKAAYAFANKSFLVLE